jgi:hypothetical protein
MELDSMYYRYEAIPYDRSFYTVPTAASPDTVDNEKGSLRISGAKDFSFDVTQGFDQGLKVDITGEVEGVGIEGNLSDKATPSSTVYLSEIEQISLKVFTKNFSGGVGNLTLNLPFGITDEIRGGRIGIHTADKEKYISTAYAINRGAFVRDRFSGEEGKQSPYFLTGAVIAGSEQVYITQGLARPVLLSRDLDYTLDYESGILSFTNRNVITVHTSIEVEYQRATEDYTQTYGQVNGSFDLGKAKTYALYRWSTDDRDNPLTFTLNAAEIESLTLAGDSARILHTYADTSAEGSYVIQNNQFVFVGQGNGDYEVTFFYVGEGNGEYIYDPVLSAFTYQGPQQGNYSPTKALPLPRREDFVGLGAEFFDAVNMTLFGSRLDLNTFSNIDDDDNNGFGYQAQIDKTIGFLSLKGNYLKYSDDFFSPRGRAAVDYRYTWNTDDLLKELAEVSLGAAPFGFLKVDAGYGYLNRTYRRKYFTLRPFFFTLGYEGIDTLDRFIAGFNKRYKALDANGRYEKYGSVQILNYGAQYAFNKNVSLGFTGTYDRDTIASGISNTLNLTTPVLLLSAGHRSISDTTFLFGSAAVNYLHKGLSLSGDLQQSQRYSQKRDEAYVQVDDGKGDYVYDPITGTYIKKEGGDFVRRVYLLPDFTRVITRNFGVDVGYTSPTYYVSGRFYYLDEKDLLSHREDIIFNLSVPAYEITLNLGQDFQDDARYALARNTVLERTASLVPSTGALTGRLEFRLMSDRIGEQERERRTTYQGEISYDVLERPIIRPKAGYGNSRIYSEYFAELDIRQHAPKVGMLFSLPLRAIKGKVETSAELVYRIYNIDDIPFFFAATEPDGLTTTLQAFAGFGVGANTVFNLIYRVQFRPDDEVNQNLRLQSRIRF